MVSEIVKSAFSFERVDELTVALVLYLLIKNQSTLTTPTTKMESNTCLQSILALSNLGVSWVRRNCFEDAIQVFIHALNQFGEDKTPVQTTTLLSNANQHLVASSSINPSSCDTPITFMSADMIIRHIRSHFREDVDSERVERKIPHIRHLIYFTESIDFSKPGAWETVIAIVFYNLGTIHFAISSAKEEKVNNAVWAAHYLWEYSVFLCEEIVYDVPDASADWITLARCLLLLLYRCLQDTSIALNLKDEDDFFCSFVEESACLWENEIFRKMPYSQTIADAAKKGEAKIRVCGKWLTFCESGDISHVASLAIQSIKTMKSSLPSPCHDAHVRILTLSQYLFISVKITIQNNKINDLKRYLHSLLCSRLCHHRQQ